MSQHRNSILLYFPSISQWTARKKDKEESAKVADDNNAVAGAASVYKALLPDNPTLLAITKWSTAFRAWVYMNTAPWEDSGWRAGAVRKHMDFMAKAGDKMAEGEALFDQFKTEYAAAREKARFQLNSLFKEDDYPMVSDVRAKFHVGIDVRPVPNADDFRIYEGLPKEEVEKLVQQAKDADTERFTRATEEAQAKLLKVVQHMADALTKFERGDQKKLFDSMTGNIAEIVEAMPALNITGDPRLDALAQQAKDLTGYAMIDLKKDKTVRDAAIKEAAALASAIRGDAPAQANATSMASVLADMEV